jgi:hypothetical protein
VRSRLRLRACLARHTPPGTVFPLRVFCYKAATRSFRIFGESS